MGVHKHFDVMMTIFSQLKVMPTYFYVCLKKYLCGQNDFIFNWKERLGTFSDSSGRLNYNDIPTHGKSK